MIPSPPLLVIANRYLSCPNAYYVCEMMSNFFLLKASEIQRTLAAALEKTLASASLLLREALVGRIRAQEAEEKVRIRRKKTKQKKTRIHLLSLVLCVSWSR